MKNYDKKSTDDYGNTKYTLNGELHRTDGPAIERTNGDREWYLNGKCHREDGPAVECADGDREWYLNGKRHREYGPAVEHPDGTREWWVNGEPHRTDGPAIEYADGTREWWVNGELQDHPINLNCPMIEFDLKQIDDRPETGQWVEIWEHNGQLWCGSYKRGEDGQVYRYHNWTDSWEHAPEPQGKRYLVRAIPEN